MNTHSDCSCESCQAACHNKPGWFKPGEIEKAAAFKQMSLPDFFKTYLGVDWWEADEPTFVISPAITTMTPGDMFPGNPSGQCVFLEEGKCSIHEAKPHECREYMHGDTNEVVKARHRETFESWQSHQDQVRKLLGREPEAESFSIFDQLGLGGYGGWQED